MATQPVFENQQSFDAAKAEAFAGKMLSAFNQGALVLMTSVGHRTGLFDAFALCSPTTSTGLAMQAGLSERYVREWLGAMTAAAIVEYDPSSRLYTLPPEHAAWLTRDAAMGNIAVSAQFLGVAAEVEPQIVERFKTGDGLCYHHYGRFHAAMAELTDVSIVSALDAHIIPLAPGLEARLQQGITAADVGCGAGRALLHLAQRYPNSQFVGLDLCADAFSATVEKARSEKLTNLRFEEFDFSGVDTLGRFDLIVAFDAAHDQKDPQAFLTMLRNSLAPSGSLLMVDIGGSRNLENNLDHPLGVHLYMMSTMHCMPVSLGQGGAGLGTMWGYETALDMLSKAGFSQVDLHRLPHDFVNAYYVAKP
ncbi:MAG: class I SAM-dependent methyltransferase [Sphingomonadaceae bacterium]|nr:class I SAM-dependent methyltransferase [Sphingomonadaceae bacterium]